MVMRARVVGPLKLVRGPDTNDHVKGLVEAYCEEKGLAVVPKRTLADIRERVRKLESAAETAGSEIGTQSISVVDVLKLSEEIAHLKGEIHMRDRSIEGLERRVKDLQSSKTIKIVEKVLDPELHVLAKKACSAFWDVLVPGQKTKRQQTSDHTKAINTLEEMDKRLAGRKEEKQSEY